MNTPALDRFAAPDLASKALAGRTARQVVPRWTRA
jgi:hypothetical protein